VCAALLPMLMATRIDTVVFLASMTSVGQLAAICCPGSLAAVTRRVVLRLLCMPGRAIQQLQASVAAAGKAGLVEITNIPPTYD
jgi:hypothetical protein